MRKLFQQLFDNLAWAPEVLAYASMSLLGAGVIACFLLLSGQQMP